MPLPKIDKSSADYKNYVFTSRVPRNTASYKMEDPAKYANLQQYLHFLRTDGVEGTKDPKNAYDPSNLYQRAWNILAARMAFAVEPNNKKKLIAQSLQGDKKEMQFRIQQSYSMLVNSEIAREFFTETRPPAMLKLMSKNGHGGELERSFKSFLLTHEAPLYGDVPPHYAPTALERIEALQDQLKKLPKDTPGYKLRAKEICMEIAATRAAVGCTIGDKSTLKKPYDVRKMNRTYQALKKAMGYMESGPVERMVSHALKGHGGAMEQDIKAAVLNDMKANNRLIEDIDPRYQVPENQRPAALRRNNAGAAEIRAEGKKTEPKLPKGQQLLNKLQNSIKTQAGDALKEYRNAKTTEEKTTAREKLVKLGIGHIAANLCYSKAKGDHPTVDDNKLADYLQNHWNQAIQSAGGAKGILDGMDAEKLGEHILSGTLSDVCRQQLNQVKQGQEQKNREVNMETQMDVTKSADSVAVL